jgi:hypothetical protein
VSSEGSFAFFSLSKIGQNSLVAKLTPIQQSAQGSITYRVYHHIFISLQLFISFITKSIESDN